MDNELIALKEGTITTKELAEWFGITYGTLRNNLEKRLEELKEYCDFEKVKKGVIIIKHIYDTEYPCYYLKRRDKKDKLFSDLVKKEWVRNYPETCVHFSEIISQKDEIQQLNFDQDKTIYNIRKAKNELFGQIKRGTRQAEGKIGTSKYVLAKKFYNSDGTTTLAPIETEEEQKIWGEIFDQYYGSVKTRMNLALEQYNNEEISAEEFTFFILETSDKAATSMKYLSYKKALAQALHCDTIVKATIVQDYKNESTIKLIETNE